MKELIIMIGLPGSGKSTYVDQHYRNFQIICADDIRKSLGTEFDPKIEMVVHTITKVICRALMERELSIVIDETNTTFGNVRFWSELGREYGYKIISILVDTNIEICKRRKQKTIEKFSDSFIVRMNDQLKILKKDANEFDLFDEKLCIV